MEVPEAIKEAKETGILEFRHVKESFTFVDPALLRGARFATDEKGVPTREAMEMYHKIRNSSTEIIDPNYRFRDFYRFNSGDQAFGFSTRHSFKFNNDYYREFVGMLERFKNYDNPLSIVEVYAVHNYNKKREGFPNFFDPVSARVRVMKIIGSRYFLSDNGYVCNSDEYNLENKELQYRRKYISL